jgi:hypothetical protein
MQGFMGGGGMGAGLTAGALKPERRAALRSAQERRILFEGGGGREGRAQ